MVAAVIDLGRVIRHRVAGPQTSFTQIYRGLVAA
jgi:hypothetical protein